MKHYQTALCEVYLLIFSFALFAQSKDSTHLDKSFKFSGDISITNNGISLIPSFALGKPALLAFFSAKKGRFSYEPQSGFSLEAKPWFTSHWLRYKLVHKQTFDLGVGTSFSAAFFSSSIVRNGVVREAILAERFINLEVMPIYKISETSSISLMYWYGFNVGKEANTERLHFLTLNGNFFSIPLGKNWQGRLIPQIFYLFQDGREGIYFSNTLGIAHRKLPLWLSSQINQPIQTNVEPNLGFLWNVLLTYSF